MKPMNVLFLTCHPDLKGGISTWVRTVRDDLSARQGVTARFLYPAYREGEKNAAERSLPERLFGGVARMLTASGEIRAELDRCRPDVIHLTTSGQLAIFRDLAFLREAGRRKIPVAYHLHFGRVPELAAAKNAEWKLLKKAMDLSARVVALDRETETALRENGYKDKTLRLPNPVRVPPAEEVLAYPKKREVVFLGWCVKTKGVEELLQGWDRVCDDFPDWTLRIIGPCESGYGETLRASYRCRQTVFQGEEPHETAMEYLRSAGALILPSYTEGLPYVVLEAMSFAKPVVATAVGAIPQVLDGCGILIRKGSAEGVETALRQVMGEEGLSARLGAAGYEKVKREYSSDVICGELARMWNAMAEERK